MARSVLLILVLVPSFAFAGFQASSYRKDSRAGDNVYNANAALDNDAATAWIVEPEQENVGQWISVDVPVATVDKVTLTPGWDKDAETFQDYARVKKGRIILTNLGADGATTQVLEHPFTLEDKRGPTVIDLPDTKLGSDFRGGQVKLIVDEVYPGQDYPALAMSEFRVDLKEFPAETTQLASEPAGTLAPSKTDWISDKNAKTVWLAEPATEAVTLSLKAPGYGLAGMEFTQGPKAYARPKTLKITANDTVVTRVLEDKPGVKQHVLLPVVVGYTGSSWGTIQVELVDSYAGDAGKGMAVAEVQLTAATLDDL